MGQVWVLPVWFKREKNLNVLKSPVKTSGSVGLVLSCWNTCTFEQIQSSEILNIVKEKKKWWVSHIKESSGYILYVKALGQDRLVVLHCLWAYPRWHCTLFFPIGLNFSACKAICKISEQLIFGDHWTTLTRVTSKWDCIYPLLWRHCTVYQNINSSVKHSWCPGSRQKCKSLRRACKHRRL